MPALYCVMGHPIGHSRSPEIHRRFAAQLGVSLEYRRIEVRSGSLEEAVRRFAQAGGRGCNITLPLKEEAAALSRSLGPEAEQAGAANTLVLGKDGGIHGDNTDGPGLLRHLRRNLGMDLEGASVLMIGAGGAARGVIPALLGAKPQTLTLFNRTRKRAVDLARRFEPLGTLRVAGHPAEELPPFDLIVNASSAGLAGQSPVLRPAAAAGAHCVDMAYGPAAAPFLSWAQEGKALSAHDGWGLLVEQAAGSFAIWHGLRPDTRELLGA